MCVCVGGDIDARTPRSWAGGEPVVTTNDCVCAAADTCCASGCETRERSVRPWRRVKQPGTGFSTGWKFHRVTFVMVRGSDIPFGVGTFCSAKHTICFARILPKLHRIKAEAPAFKNTTLQLPALKRFNQGSGLGFKSYEPLKQTHFWYLHGLVGSGFFTEKRGNLRGQSPAPSWQEMTPQS